MKIERYQAYKDSEVAWLGDVPEHWETHTVKRVAKVGYKNFVDGDWIESPFITDKGIRLIQTGNVGIGIYKEKGWRYISEKTFNDLNCTEIFPGDVLICRLDGPVGRACLVPDIQVRMITSVDNTILKPSKDFDSKFIVYVMSSSLWLDWTQALCRVGGGFRFRISRSMLGELRIQKPPISEQKAIAHYLDTKTTQIDRKIDLLTQKATLYGNLKQSLINETVTRGLDKSVPMKDSGIEWLGEVPEHWKCGMLNGIARRVVVGIAEAATQAYAEEGTPILRSTNIRAGKIIGDIFYINSVFANDRKSKLIKAGDLVTVRTGNVGVTAVVPKELDGCQCFTMLITTLTRLASTSYYCYWMNSVSAQRYFYLTGWGTAQVNISVPILQALPIPIPPFDEQKTIANYLDTKTAQIDQIIQTINTQIEKLKELRKTLINDVVTGKIRVIDNE